MIRKSVGRNITIIVALIVGGASCLYAQLASRKLNPAEVFNLQKPVIFSDKFQSDLHKWVISINALDRPDQRPLSTPLVKIVPAPGLSGISAVRFDVPGDPGAFRSEIALPAELKSYDRWYGERFMLPTLPADDKGYIVMQWHAVQGPVTPGIACFPNIAIWIKNDQWEVRRSFGSPIHVERDTKVLAKKPHAGEWTSFVIHIKWSKSDDGEIELWQNGTKVWREQGVNLYTDHARDITPYLKTGIYRPSRRNSITKSTPTIVYISNVKIGGADATYETVDPTKWKVSGKVEG